MWTLECEGDSLAHKTIWLRPGKKYLFGRTKQQASRDMGIRIDNKSISRQHLTISVSPVKSGEGYSVRHRSEITFRDEDTKFKTEIDGEKIKNESRMLKKDEHIFKLGNLDQKFRIKWFPVVFTFSFSSKQMKQGSNPLAAFCNRLEELDIKVTTNYVVDATTHVVAGKRNTAKGLQALVNGKFIVNETFVDALVYATTPSNLDEAESFSPLEEDFTGNWPDAREHLPAKSKEPSERPAEYFAPKLERGQVFEGYKFVFCDAIQYDTLHPPITNGGGKAFHFKLNPGTSTAREIVGYVKSIAGEEGHGELEDGGEGKGVVVVRFRPKGYEDWALDLDREIAQSLDLRLIEQSEFLDAILMNDASMLWRRLQASTQEEASIPSSKDAGRPEERGGRHVGPPEATEPSESVLETPPKRNPTRKVVSRFKGFDDDSDDGPSIQYTQPAPSQSQRPSTKKAMAADDSIDSDDQFEVQNGHTESRKRPAPSSDIEDGEDFVDKLLPAATAMKRRRLEDAANGISAESSLSHMSQAQVQTAPKKSKPKKEVNIKEVVRERREAEEAARHEEEITLQESLEGMTVEEMKSLAVVEEMDMPAHRTTASNVDGGDNPRWDERWNGRKNFKKFRRRGEGGVQPARRGPSVIVPLEEAKRKDFGIGDAYWQGEAEEKSRQRQKEKPRMTKSQSQSQLHSQSQQMLYTTARSQNHEIAEIPSELVADTGPGAPEVIDIDAPRATRGQELRQQLDESSGRSSTKTTASQPAVNGKRPATGPMAPPVVKKRKKFAAAQDSDSD